MKQKDYLVTLTEVFENMANPAIAAGQKAYMKGKFDYYGIQSPVRREIQKPFFESSYLPDKADLPALLKQLWNKPQREFHYFAMELFARYKKQMVEEDIELMEFLVTNHSWWDTVDFISVHLIGNYFMKFPDNRLNILQRWLDSGNIWLQRASILYQLKYKNNVDTEWMSFAILKLSGTKEFFLNKAIGWVLREYSRTNPDWVMDFVQEHTLSNLSKREALRLMMPT